MHVRALALLSVICVAALACGGREASTPTMPDSAAGTVDVRLVTAFYGAGSDNTERQWSAAWSVFLDAGTRPLGAPSDGGTVVPSLPTPVTVAEVASTVVAPDGHTLASVLTSPLQITLMNLFAVNTGTNQVTRDRGIVVNQTALYEIGGPSPTSQASIVVRLIDGQTGQHDVRLSLEIRQERPRPGPCTTRDQPSGRVNIGPSGLDPKELHVSRGICVAFVNQDTVAHDIRSDPHSAHSDCPELNVGPVPAGAGKSSLSVSTWGTCAYHDELRPDDERFKGRFTIDPPPGL